jgi:magnesium transporter
VIVDCALYRDGKRTEETRNLLRLAAEARRDPSAFVWMGLHEPTETDLLGVSRIFGLHPLAVEDAVRAHQRPKVEAYPGHLFVVLRTLTYHDDTSQVETGEVAVFIGKDFVITVRHGDGQELHSLREKLEARPERLATGPASVLHGVVDSVVDTYSDVAASLQRDVDEVEGNVFGDDVVDDSSVIYNLKREVLEFKRAVLPLGQALDRVQSDKTVELGEESRPFWRDVADHVARVSDQVESMDALLTSILQAHVAQVSLRQNSDMRKITAWAAIITVPTMLAGIWGMNFKHMPELQWRYGYPLALAVIVGSSLTLLRAFKRSGWL